MPRRAPASSHQCARIRDRRDDIESEVTAYWPNRPYHRVQHHSHCARSGRLASPEAGSTPLARFGRTPRTLNSTGCAESLALRSPHTYKSTVVDKNPHELAGKRHFLALI